MSTMEVDRPVSVEPCTRPRRHRTEPQRAFSGANLNQKTLELEGIVNVLKEYHDYEGGINCSICGKLYKSKVCFTKHLWEHSVYWDLFDGEKNHDRVLSIQAALILYQHQGACLGLHSDSTNDEGSLQFLLVTAPHQDKKKDKESDGSEIKGMLEKKCSSPSKRKTPSKRVASPTKRKRHSDSLCESTCSSSSGSDSESAKT